MRRLMRRRFGETNRAKVAKPSSNAGDQHRPPHLPLPSPHKPSIPLSRGAAVPNNEVVMHAPLAHLSLTRCGRSMPHVPDNAQRLQAFRKFQPVQFANEAFRLSECERYALEQRPGFDYETELLEGFDMKYGAAHGAD